MNIWVFPGTFDPITTGHEITIRRAAFLCDLLVVCVIDNYNKMPLFSVDERIRFISLVCDDIDNVTVKHVSEITAEYAKSIGAKVIIRGLRSSNELEKELVLAHYYRSICPDVETIFLPSSRQENDFTSSSLIKDIAFHNGDLTKIVNQRIIDDVKKRFIEL